MAQDTQQTAKNVASSLSGGISTSSAGIGAPTTAQEAGVQSEGGKQLLQRAITNASGDINLKTRLDDLRRGENAALASKRAQGLNFAQNIGSIRERIAQAQYDAQKKQATSGFIGSGATVNANLDLQRQANRTLTDEENRYLSQLRNANAQLGVSRQAEIDTLKGTGALNKAFAQEAVLQSQDPNASNMVDFEKDQGVVGSFFGTFGKDQTWSGKLNEDAFKQNAAIKSIAQEFGIDSNSGNFISQVNDAMSKTITMKADSTWDMTRDISVDMGNGLQKVGEQTKQLGEAVMDVAGGLLNIAAVAIPLYGFAAAAGSAAMTGLTTMVEASVAESIGGVLTAEAGTAIGEAIAAGGIELTATGVVGDSIGATIAQSVAEAGLQVGGEELGAEVISGMGTSLSESIQQELVTSIGEEVAASLPAGQVRMAIEAADDTVQSLLAAKNGFAGVSSELSNTLSQMGVSLAEITEEEIIQAATINAMGILESEEVAAMVTEGGAEAFVGSEGAVVSGGVQGAGQGAVQGTEQAAVQGATQGAKGFRRITQGVKNMAKGTGGPAKSIGGLAVKSIGQGIKGAAKTAFLTDIGAISTSLGITASATQSLLGNLEKRGISQDVASEVLKELAKTGKSIGGR